MTRLARDSEFAPLDTGKGQGKAGLSDEAVEKIRTLVDAVVDEIALSDLPIDWLVRQMETVLRAAHGAALDDRRLARAAERVPERRAKLSEGRRRSVKSNAKKAAVRREAARRKRKAEG